MSEILIISAHPDDMEIGMGGTATLLGQRGEKITSLVVTDGRRSPNPFAFPREELAKIRKQEAESAGKILGIQNLISFDLSDLKDPANVQKAEEELQTILKKMRPVEIYILHPELDRHPTHRASGTILIQALERTPEIQAAVWAYEVWGLFAKWDRFEDISSVINKKIAAVQAHKSQIAAIPYTEGVLGLNRWRAIFADPGQMESNIAYAEVFLRLK